MKHKLLLKTMGLLALGILPAAVVALAFTYWPHQTITNVDATTEKITDGARTSASTGPLAAMAERNRAMTTITTMESATPQPAEDPRQPPPDGFAWSLEEAVATAEARPPEPSPTPAGWPSGRLPEHLKPIGAWKLVERFERQPFAFANEYDGKRVLVRTGSVQGLLGWELDPAGDGIRLDDLTRARAMWGRGSTAPALFMGNNHYVEMQHGKIRCLLDWHPKAAQHWRQAYLQGDLVISGVVRPGPAPLLLTECRVHGHFRRDSKTGTLITEIQPVGVDASE